MGILGIDIGGTNIRTGLVEKSNLLNVLSSGIIKGGSETEILNNLLDMIGKYDKGKIEGIGIGVPSVVDIENGIVYDVQNIPSWKKVHLKKILETEYKVPVYVNNDANCFAVGEKYFGKVKQYKDIVGLIIGTGLGSGIIINDRLYAGNNCGAGEFGMIPFKDKNYEYYCSGQYFLNEFGISGNELSEKAFNKDPEAIKIFKSFGSNLGEAIKMIMYALDPEVIILGGSVSKSFHFFKDDMWDTIKSFSYSNSAHKIKIKISDKNNIAILGAAALFFNAHSKSV